MMNIYQEELMDHYRYPRNTAKLDRVNFSAGDDNPSCGDRVFVEGCVSGDTVAGVRFEGTGCILSLATCSMLTDLIKGKSLDYGLGLSAKEVLNLVGIELGPNRLRCALLSLEVIHRGLETYRKNTEAPSKGQQAQTRKALAC